MNNSVSTSFSSDYTGRFAPTPSGPLHFGSLATALASYLDAHHVGGQWLIRMEDLDPPREIPGAADTILRQLESHGLEWHGSVLYQSQRDDIYQDAIDKLTSSGLCYPCDCTRQRLNKLNGVYDSHCRITKPATGNTTAIRLNIDAPPDYGLIEFTDLIQGVQHRDLHTGCGDFIIKRKDQLFAYQLACAVDDMLQQITHVIRGHDLLDSTPRQLQVIKTLNHNNPNPDPEPAYGHIPIATGSDGKKLSKQNMATAINNLTAADNLRTALTWLNQNWPTELSNAPVAELLSWAIKNWRRERIPSVKAELAPQKMINRLDYQL